MGNLVRCGGIFVTGRFYAHGIAKGHLRTETEGWGFGLGVVYLAWIGYVVALYPLCRWFEGVKQRRRDWWLGYL